MTSELSVEGRRIKKAVNRAKTGVFKPFTIGERKYYIVRQTIGEGFYLQDDRGYLLSDWKYPPATVKVELTQESVLMGVQRLQETYTQAVDEMCRGW